MAGTDAQTSSLGFTKELGGDSQVSGHSDRPEGLSLQVKEESGRLVLTWQGRGGVRGFILHRTEKGKDNYTPISNLIPYFGRGERERYLHKYAESLTLADEDININWESYKERFLKGGFP